MTITDYIKELEAIRKAHGDLEVWESSYSTTMGAIGESIGPKVTHIAILTGMERTQRRVLSIDPPSKRGEKIVMVGR